MQPPTVLSIFGVEPLRIGGVETLAREVSRQLGERGWRSVLCFLAEPREPVRSFLALPNVELATLASLDPPHRVARPAAALLRRVRPRILHLYFTGFLSPYPWLGRLCGARRVYFTDQGSQPEGYVPAPAAAWKRVLGRAITWPLERVISISDYNAEVCRRRGFVSPARVCRIYNSVDLARPSAEGAAFRRKYNIPEDRLIVLQVSWIIPEKGIPDLLEAARLVLAREPRAHFVIAGEGAFRAEYTARGRELGIADRLTWTGLLEDPMGEGLYAAADVVCQLSRWQEAFGWVIVEAMACRKPIVATRAGGIPEIVEDGRSGYLVPPRAPGEAAEQILRLLADPPLRDSLGAHGRRAAELRFTLGRNVAELLKLYGEPC